MLLSLLLAPTLLSSRFQAATAHGSGRITVQVDRPGVKISPTLFGLMTEEINHAYDGGLYAELIRNRVFKDDPRRPVFWSIEGGTMELDDADPVSGTALDRCLKVLPFLKSDTGTQLTNEGYWGVPIVPNTTYELSFYAKGDPSGKSVLRPRFSGPEASSQAEFAYVVLDPSWKQYHLRLRTGAVKATGEGRFSLSLNSPGPIWITQVSLFPPTYHNQKNGFRKDLMRLLNGLKPSFLRLPGGNYLEGDTIETRFNWKKTLGAISRRPGHMGTWGYRSSDGLGLYEYMMWCDDMHAQPVLAVWAGYALGQQHVDPGPDLAPYVQDALDEIEFVTGDANTKWGAVRAKLGHPRPWKLTYVEIGNEDAFDRSRTYDGRFAQFYDAIKAKYPQLQVIATADVRSRKPDVVDDHYYRSAAAMARDAGHYDGYDRKGPKIFVGEWASVEGRPTPNHRAALGDAAWLTGLERNSDLVVMESYAPLLVNVSRPQQWPTNLIGYDNRVSFGSPSYYVQSMFANNTGDRVLPTGVEASVPKVEAAAHGAIGLGSWITDVEYKDVSVEGNGIHYSKDFGATGTEGWTFPRGMWKVEDGTVHQTTLEQDTAAIGGDPAWTDYTLSVKARKIRGAEGFMVRVHVHDADNYWQWNIGGWGDSRSALQQVSEGNSDEVEGTSTNTTIETGKWYDVRIHVGGGKIECYLDGRLITTASEREASTPKPIYAAASLESSTGEVFLKVVNTSAAPIDATVDLSGAGDLDSVARGWEMTGEPGDQNSVTQPTRVAPKPIEVRGVSASFTRTFPAYSVSVLRFRRK